MASFLLPECLEKIFLDLYNPSNTTLSTSTNLSKTKDLYSCTLVSRYWCRVSTPLLYSHPFSHFRHLINYLNDQKKSPQIEKDVQDYYKLIGTLLNCIPQSEIEKVVDSKQSFTQPISYSLK